MHRVLVAPGPHLRGLATLHELTPAGITGTAKDGGAPKDCLRLRTLEELPGLAPRTDEHLVTYFIEAEGVALERAPRLLKEALPQIRAAGGRVLHEVVAVDHDLKDLHNVRGKLPWSDLTPALVEATWTRVHEAAFRLQDVGLGWSMFYATKNGFRTLHRLALPVPPEGYEVLVQRLLAAYRVVGLAPDPACKDWTRLFRCPNATREDSLTWQESYYCLEPSFPEQLNIPEEVELTEAAPPVVRVAVDRPRADRPDPEAARSYVEVQDPTNNQWRLTDAAKKAKRELREAGCFSAIFDHTPLAHEGDRHNSLLRAVGEVIARLHGFPWATLQLCYGLLLPVADALGDDEAWAGKAWEMLTNFWHKEDAKKATQAAQVEQKVALVEAVKLTAAQRLLVGVRQWRTDLVGMPDEQALKAVLDERLALLQDRRRDLFYVMTPDGFYDTDPCVLSALPRVIENKGLTWLVPTQFPKTDERGETTFVEARPDFIARGFATEFARQEIRFDQFGTYLGRDEHGNNLLCHVPFRLRTDIPAVRVPEIDGLWQLAFRDRYDDFCRAIGALLAWDFGPTAAVCVVGPPNSGKSLISLGLADCVSTGRVAPSRALVDNFNAPMLWSPIIVVEEGADRGSKGIDGADALRRIVTGAPVSVEKKGMDPMPMDGVHRIFISSNSYDVLTRLLGDRARASYDWNAVSERVVTFDVHPDAAEFFVKGGGREATVGWIGGRGKQPGLYAQQLMWAYKNCLPWEDGKPKWNGRLIVSGRQDSKQFGDLESGAGATPEIAVAINRMIGTQHVILSDGKVHLTTQAVVDNAHEFSRMPRGALKEALTALLDQDQPSERLTVAGKQGWWKVIDARRLCRIIIKHTNPHRAFEAFL